MVYFMFLYIFTTIRNFKKERKKKRLVLGLKVRSVRCFPGLTLPIIFYDRIGLRAQALRTSCF